MAVDLTLDPAIRNWVLVPILVVMTLVQVTRSWAQVLMTSDKAPMEPDQWAAIQLLQRSGKLRANSRVLPASAWHMRREYLCAKGGVGKLRRKFDAPVNPMQNPDGMMDMMKGQMGMMVPQMVMMGWISFFFSGFVLVRIPITLTEGFKQMLQRGVELQTLEVSYVSSLSWYFLVMFGMRGFFALILGEASVPDDTALMQQQMGMGAGPQAFDGTKAFKAERVAIKHVEHKCQVDEAEALFLAQTARRF